MLVESQQRDMSKMRQEYDELKSTHGGHKACEVCSQLQDALEEKEQQLRKADVLSEQRWQEAATEYRMQQEVSNAWDHQKAIADQYCRDKKEKEKLLLEQGEKYLGHIRHLEHAET